jgi:hypothetical protein
MVDHLSAKPYAEYRYGDEKNNSGDSVTNFRRPLDYE